MLVRFSCATSEDSLCQRRLVVAARVVKTVRRYRPVASSSFDSLEWNGGISGTAAMVSKEVSCFFQGICPWVHIILTSCFLDFVNIQHGGEKGCDNMWALGY